MPLMAEIYAKASRVIVLLGEASSDSSEAAKPSDSGPPAPIQREKSTKGGHFVATTMVSAEMGKGINLLDVYN